MKKLFYAFGKRLSNFIPSGRRITADSDVRMDATGNTRIIASA